LRDAARKRDSRYRVGNTRAVKQLLQWKLYVEYVKTNPQRLPAPALKARVSFTYRQALLSLRHYPEMWFEAASRLRDV
jgi:cleavage stimulation factor subunit 3